MAERLVRQPLEVERLRLGAALGISQRRLHGWEPRQFHRGYDRDGNQVALAEAFEIVVETESEWVDDERTRLLGLRQYDRSICECGFPVTLTADPANHFAIEERRCPVCASSAQYHRRLHDEDEKHRKQQGDDAPAGGARPSDGRHVGLRPMGVDEVEAHRRRRRAGSSGGTPNGSETAPRPTGRGGRRRKREEAKHGDTD